MLDPTLGNLTEIGLQNQDTYIRNQCKQQNNHLEKVFVTVTEREKKEAYVNLSKETLLSKLQQSLLHVKEDVSNFSQQVKEIQKQRRKTIKTDMVQLLEEIDEHIATEEACVANEEETK